MQVDVDIDIDELSDYEIIDIIENLLKLSSSESISNRNRFKEIFEELQKSRYYKQLKELVNGISGNDIDLSRFGIKLNSLADEVKFFDYLKAYKEDK